jgi:hypothetical protein
VITIVLKKIEFIECVEGEIHIKEQLEIDDEKAKAMIRGCFLRFGFYQ